MLSTILAIVVTVVVGFFLLVFLVIGFAYLRHRVAENKKKIALHKVIGELESPGNTHSLEECIDFLKRIKVINYPAEEGFVSLYFLPIRDYLSPKELATVVRWVLKWRENLDQKVALELYLLGKEKAEKILRTLEEKAPNEYEKLLPTWVEECDRQEQNNREAQKEELIKKALEALEIE